MPTFYSRPQLAKKLNLSVRTIAALQYAGKIPFLRINNKTVRYDAAAVALALQSLIVKPANQ